jgi:hypothetical protein
LTRAGRFALLPAALFASLTLAASASADTVEVTTNLDNPGPGCTLRDAVASQQVGNGINDCDLVVAAGPNTVTFAPSLTGATITLTGGELIIDDADPDGLDIVGPGMNQLTVSGQDTDRVFNFSAATTATISGLSVIDGNPAAVDGIAQGGGIRNEGELTLTDVLVTDNEVTATSTLTNVFADGAGVYNGGSITLDHSRVEGNAADVTAAGSIENAQARGAGIFSDLGGTTMVIENSTIADNPATATNNSLGTADALAVGGMYSAGDLDVTHSTFSGNSATASHTVTGTATTVGAILAEGTGTSNLELSTVAANLADPSGPGATFPAGGIYSQASVLAIRSSTIAFNGPTSQATPLDGVNLIAFGVVQLTNSILSDPRGGGDNCLDFGSAITSGFTVDFTPGPGFSGSCLSSPAEPTDLTSDPLLSAAGLANNGGPTATIALQPASPAIDAGSNTGVTDPTHDQRGLTRPVEFSGIPNAAGGNGTDIGPFEVQLACAGQAAPSTACPSGGGIPPAAGPTGQRAAAKKACKRKFKGKAKAKKRKKCIKRANQLPV